MRRPIGIAFLNFVFPGGGYLFLQNRQKRVFGLLLVLAAVLGIVWSWIEQFNPFFTETTSLWFVSTTTTGTLVEVLAWIFAAAAFAYDGFQEAKKEQ